MKDSYIYVITALLPLAACMLVFQTNPYHALVIRGILGAIATLVFAVLGASDVALTEALMGTMLAITLYAVAVRSSLVLRLGVLAQAIQDESAPPNQTEGDRPFGKLMDDLRAILSKRHMRLELLPYTDTQALQLALINKEVHATCTQRLQPEYPNPNFVGQVDGKQTYETAIRVQRLYEIMQNELSTSETILTYVNAPDAGSEDR